MKHFVEGYSDKAIRESSIRMVEELSANCVRYGKCDPEPDKWCVVVFRQDADGFDPHLNFKKKYKLSSKKRNSLLRQMRRKLETCYALITRAHESLRRGEPRHNVLAELASDLTDQVYPWTRLARSREELLEISDETTRRGDTSWHLSRCENNLIMMLSYYAD